MYHLIRLALTITLYRLLQVDLATLHEDLASLGEQIQQLSDKTFTKCINILNDYVFLRKSNHKTRWSVGVSCSFSPLRANH